MNETVKKVIKELMSYVVIVLVVLFIKFFIVSPIRVNGNSMDATLKDNDLMLLNEIVYRFSDIKRNDIVVVREDDEYIIKRIIGLPGEKIACDSGIIYINGKKYDDKFALNETSDFELVTLKSDEYFVLGDNRKVSLDSRFFGPYKKSDIRGRASFTIFPFSRFGSKK